MAFHKGELAIQERAGVSKQASRIGASIQTKIPPLAQEFLRYQPLVFLSSIDKNQRVWATFLTGKVGFMEVIDDETLKIEPETIDESLFENLRNNQQIGLLAIEFETRRRMRVNGLAEISGNSIIVHTREVFSNCPKYIQARFWENEGNSKNEIEKAKIYFQLTELQKCLIEKADTFIIASAQKSGGADVSHRGGNPGFVRVLDDKNLIFPDYSGNMMFQTLGNLETNPHCGLLFWDFADGRVLQLTGKAKIIWDKERIKEFSGAERLIEFELIEARESIRQTDLSWYFLDYSPFNPK